MKALNVMGVAGAGQQTTISTALSLARRKLAQAGIPDQRSEGHLLLAHVTGAGRTFILTHPCHPLSSGEAAAFEALLERRIRREPISHIVGRREFWSLDLLVSADVLDPRPDSETLIEAALKSFPERNGVTRILDLGTGSGCLLLALLSEFPSATGIGTDISATALDVARSNAERLGLAGRATLERQRWGEKLKGTFNLIVTNPPYIADCEIDRLEPEVACFEPRLALSGGTDGLQAYRDLAPDVKRLLAPNGIALFEIGHDQAEQVSEIIASAGLQVTNTWLDLAGKTRCVGAKQSQ